MILEVAIACTELAGCADSPAQEVSNKGGRACLRRVAQFRRVARLTSTWALTLTAVVEVDVAVDVEPIVDLDVGLRVRSSSSASRRRWLAGQRRGRIAVA